MIIAVATLLTASLSAYAQMGGGGGGGPGGGGGGGAGGGGGGGAGSGLGGTGGNNNSSLGSGTLGISTGGTGSSLNGSGPSQSNFLNGYFSYPIVTALGPISTGTGASSTTSVSSTVTHTIPAYGGTAYNTTTTGTGGRGGAGAAGRATVGGGGARGGASGTANVYGFNAGTSGDTLARMPFYVASIQFERPVFSQTAFQNSVKDVISRSTRLPSKNQIQVVVNGRDVVLRGEVSNERESRAAETQIRMTPGVGQITNELTYKQ
jgi:hypothetical protein